MGLCVFCSSVFFCEKENASTVRERMFICEKQASPRADPSDWMRVVEGLFDAKRVCKADVKGRSTYSLFTFQMVNS